MEGDSRTTESHMITDTDKKADGDVTPAQGTSSLESNKKSKDNAPDECPKSVSPEPNCSICLGKLENKSFTDSCFHTFCFVCLLEWSKVKAVCPLCKQAFKSIIHNVRSFEDYDQYHLRTEEQAAEELETRRFRFHSTMTNERWWNHLRMEQQRQLALLRRPSRDTLATQWRRQRQAATSAYRRRIYASGMRVQEVRTATGRTMRYREVSPEFYRRNPACMHRLVPWLNRELNVLLNNHEDHVQFVLELILDLIKRFDIQSEEFFQHIQPFTGRRTEHFVHEFYSFARSPYDMFAYDQRAVYNEPEEQPVHMIDSSDNESSIQSPTVIEPDDYDDDVILISSTEPNSLPADEMTTSQDHPYSSAGATLTDNVSSDIGTMPELSSVDLTSLINQVQSFVSGVDTRTPGESSWDSPTPGPSNVDNLFSPLQGTCSDTAIDITDTTPVVKVKEETDNDEDSDSSDVVVVGYEKPWEERSPLQISSDDEEERQTLSDQEKQEKKHQKQDKVKKHKKHKSRSRSRERRSRSHSHGSKSKKARHSHERSKPHSRHETHRQRSRSREHGRRDCRETAWERSKDRNHHYSKEYSSSRYSRASRSRSPRHYRAREDVTVERDHHRHRDARSPSWEELQYSALGQYDYSDTRSERSSKQGSRRGHSRSPSERTFSDDRRRQNYVERESSGKKRHKRSRSKSVEIIFCRRDRSKDRQRRERKHKHDRHSPSRSCHNKSKHKSSKGESSSTVSPQRENPKQSSGNSLASSSSDSKTEGELRKTHYKKHPTGHKCSQSDKTNSHDSQKPDNHISQDSVDENDQQRSEVDIHESDPEQDHHNTDKCSAAEDLLSSDSDVQVTRHQHHIQSISSESDASSPSCHQVTSDKQVELSEHSPTCISHQSPEHSNNSPHVNEQDIDEKSPLQQSDCDGSRSPSVPLPSTVEPEKTDHVS